MRIAPPLAAIAGGTCALPCCFAFLPRVPFSPLLSSTAWRRGGNIINTCRSGRQARGIRHQGRCARWRRRRRINSKVVSQFNSPRSLVVVGTAFACSVDIRRAAGINKDNFMAKRTLLQTISIVNIFLHRAWYGSNVFAYRAA
jgi:hypothetical protein